LGAGIVSGGFGFAVGGRVDLTNMNFSAVYE
jgi:hypothetical protein